MLTVPNGELETLHSLDFTAHTDSRCCPGQYPLEVLSEDRSIPFPVSCMVTWLHCLHFLGNVVTFTLWHVWEYFTNHVFRYFIQFQLLSSNPKKKLKKNNWIGNVFMNPTKKLCWGAPWYIKLLSCPFRFSFFFILGKVEFEKIISPQSEKPQEVSKEQGKAPRAELAPAKGLKRRKSSTLFV